MRVVARALSLATFLLLLLGAHVMLMSGYEWTADAYAVQNGILALAGVCFVSACGVAVHDMCWRVQQMRREHIQAWDTTHNAEAKTLVPGRTGGAELPQSSAASSSDNHRTTENSSADGSPVPRWRHPSPQYLAAARPHKLRERIMRRRGRPRTTAT